MSNSDRIRLGVVAALVLAVTASHYLTGLHLHQFHDIYRRLYYVPIVLGGLWFALRGGIGTALAVSVLFAPHVVFQWGDNPALQPEQYLEILLYNVIGLLTGLLTERLQQQKLSYQRTAERLEESYAELKRQSDQIIEIEEQLRRADRLSALGELSAGMAHEIRNPLGSIRGTAEILQDGIDPADPKAEFARILVKEVDRLNRVVQDFLDFARPAEVVRGAVDVAELLRELQLLTRQPAHVNGVSVDLADGGAAPVAGDREQLKQAFLNLMLNAIQAMPQGGSLQLETAGSDGQVTVRFADTGRGIPAEHLERIFNPFFTTRRDGTGLGLAITHRIVQGHGGRIDVTSQPGIGTVFTLTLPAATGAP